MLLFETPDQAWGCGLFSINFTHNPHPPCIRGSLAAGRNFAKAAQLTLTFFAREFRACGAAFTLTFGFRAFVLSLGGFLCAGFGAGEFFLMRFFAFGFFTYKV